MKIELLTLEKFTEWVEFGNFQEAIKLTEEFYLPWKQRPVKPTLHPYKHTKAEVLAYAELLDAYENEEKEFKKYNKKRESIEEDIKYIIHEFIKQEHGLYDIPEQYQEKVWYRAVEDADSNYDSIIYHLENLVEIFN